jgi:serine/threonine protein kinase
MLQQIIKNRYEICQFLGKGGFGETYLAKDLDFPNHPFRVVKILRPDSNDPQTLQIARDLFKREAEVLSNLGKTDLIPELFAYFEVDQEFYLVQEWIEGEDLTKEISPGQQLPENQVIELIRDILIALQMVHQNNVIHRDIKPSNLMRRRQDGKIVVIDFGGVKQIANSKQNLNLRTIGIGTPGYYPLEQISGFPVLASDIYAVGMIAIQALTGQFPIPNDWEQGVTISSRFRNILKQMITDDLNIRYSSAMEALEAINSLSQPSSKASLKTQNITVNTQRQTLSPLIWKIGLAGLAIAIFLGIFSLKFDFPNPSDNTPKSPPPGWTW